MEKLKSFAHYINENCTGCLCLCAALLKSDFGELNVPVTEQIPDEIIKLLYSDTKLEFIKIICNLFGEIIELRKNPFILEGKVSGNVRCLFVLCKIHKDETGSIPNLVSEVTGGLDLLIGITHIVSGAVTCSESEAESISTVLIDNEKRIDTVTERLTHLSAQLVTDNTVNEYCVKGYLIHLLTG